MGITYSAKGIGTALLTFIGLAILASLSISLVATGVDMVKPGWGAALKSWSPFK